ncbi:MFS transporter [Kribbella sp. NPDC051718]|uniref:MFS transporter n=1 Tax=Kribbella sp. NPDC051718 TaxID=3155168 RepID=UPI0034151521
MSEEVDRDPAPAEQPGTGLGAIATWRQTSLTSKALLFGVFVNRLGAFLQIFLVLFMTHKGFSAGEAGFALGVYGAGHVLGSFVGGWLTDRLSARAATLISMLGSAALIVSILYIKPYWLILLAILVVSTVSMLNRPAAQAMLAELTKPGQLVMTMAMYRLAINLGTAVTPIVGVALVSVSYNLLFWAEAFAAILYSAIAWKFLPGKPSAAEAAEKAAAKAAEKKQGYRAVLADWRYDFYLAAVFLVTIVYCQYLAVLPLAIVDDGMSLWWYSLVVSANAIVVAVCEVPATKYVQTWPLRITAIAGFGLVAVGYGMYAIALIPALLIVGTIIWTASEIIGAPTTFAYPGMVAPPHLMGRYSGAMLTVFGLGNAVGPAVGVWAWSHLGQSFWIWAAGVAVLSAVCARIGMRRPDGEPSKIPAPTPTTDPSTEPAT